MAIFGNRSPYLAGCKSTAEWLMLILMLICYERKILLNGWLILANKFKRTGRMF
jgi:hypothetical protein